MKMLSTLLLAVALFALAFGCVGSGFGQSRLEAKFSGHATKMTVLYTGKPITAGDKLKLLTTVAGKLPQGTGKSETVTLTPAKMYKAGFVTAQALSMNADFGMTTPEIEFDFVKNGNEGNSFLEFFITAKANTAYELVYSISQTWTATPSFLVSLNGQNSQTITGTAKGTMEFAYAFVASTSGNMMITVTSPNAGWGFNSCEITATPLN
jgi:hypothetical protein